MPILSEIELFVKTAELRNFGRAADALNITASTLSRRISKLEKELGMVLIRRSTRNFSLSEAGQQLFERSRKLVEEASRTKEELSSNFNKISGHVRAGASADLTTIILTPSFAQFCLENPAVSLDIIATQGQPEIDRDNLDVAFAVTHQTSLPNSSYLTRPVGSFQRMLFASKTYLEKHGVPENPKDLQLHNCVRFLAPSAEKHWRLHRDRRSQMVPVGGNCASSSAMAAAQAARGHVGIAMLPGHLASHPIYGAGLVRVMTGWVGTPVNVLAVTADRKMPARIEEIIRIVKTNFEDQIAKLKSA